MERGVSSITGVDISEKMIEIASEKYGNHSEIELIADDVENISLSNMYDCCIVYNAFPHFVDPQLLIECMAENLTKNGRLTIAHGMSREKIDGHHSNGAEKYIFVAAVKDLRYNKKLTGNFYKGGRIEK